MLNESHSFDTLVVTPWDAAPQDYTQQVKTAIGLCRKYTGLTFLHIYKRLDSKNKYRDKAFIMPMHLEAASYDSNSPPSIATWRRTQDGTARL